jgi:hypothetical protein
MADHLTLETEVAPENGESEMTAVPEYRITVARIETAARRELKEHVRVTFQVEREPISFQIPVFLSSHDFDDTEMIRVARNTLHRTFTELAAASENWELTPAELQGLSDLNVRPTNRSESNNRTGTTRQRAASTE